MRMTVTSESAAWNQRNDSRQPEIRQHATNSRCNRREDEALPKKLSYQTATRCAECDSHGKFALTVGPRTNNRFATLLQAINSSRKTAASNA